MNAEVEKLYVLITGASAGIGKCLATEFAEKGYNLFLVSLPGTGLEKIANELKMKYSIDVELFNIDLTEYDAPRKVYEFAEENSLTIQILVNNAGVGYDGKLEELSLGLVDSMILLNIRASTLLTFLFLPGMKKLPKAYVLNMSSFAAFVPLPYKCVYAATKTYLLFLTRALNSELKGSKVLVTSVHPSGVTSERAYENIQKLSFLSKITTLSPEDVAKIAVKNMLKGNKFVVPGMATKFYYLLGSVIPQGILLRMVGRIFRKTS